MFLRCRSLYSGSLKLQSSVHSKCMSGLTKAEAKERRNLLFEKEKKKQRESVGRIEKIEVMYKSVVNEVTLIVNKDISTPYDCARHISQGCATMSALALVDNQPWDMHKPLPSACEIEFLTMKSPKLPIVNYAYWRTCSMLLGAVLENAFNDDITIHLHSFPIPNIMSGSFIYDVFLDLPNWEPTDAELRALSALFVKFTQQELPIERLTTTESVALEMFQDNPFKSEQIPNIAKNNDEKVTLYRIGTHVDISKGPMIGNTVLIGRSTIPVVHKLNINNLENMYRVQGISLPKSILLNHFAYNILEERAKKLNAATCITNKSLEEMEHEIISSASN